MRKKDNSNNFIDANGNIRSHSISLAEPQTPDTLTKADIINIARSLGFGASFRDHTERVEIYLSTGGKMVKSRSLGRFAEVSLWSKEKVKELIKEKFEIKGQNNE